MLINLTGRLIKRWRGQSLALAVADGGAASARHVVEPAYVISFDHGSVSELRTSVVSGFASAGFLLHPDEGRSFHSTSSLGSEVTPRSLIASAIGLWFPEEGTGRCVFLLVAAESDRKSEGSWKGGTEQEAFS